MARDSAEYALRMIDRITRRSQQIGEYPLAGRIVPEYDADDVREVIEGPLRIIDRVRREQVDVLSVLHGARMPPKEV